MTMCRFYLDDKRQVTTRYNLDLVEKDWSRGGFILGEPVAFMANAGVWLRRTGHSLTVVNTEGHVLYWKQVPANVGLSE